MKNKTLAKQILKIAEQIINPDVMSLDQIQADEQQQDNNIDKYSELEKEYSVENIEINPSIYDVINSEEPFEEKRIKLLKMASGTEQLAEINYIYSYNYSLSSGKIDYDPEFEQHEEDEREHKTKINLRLREVGGVADSDFNLWIPNNVITYEPVKSRNSLELLKDRLKEEVASIKFYGILIDFFRNNKDYTTQKLFKEIQEKEYEHRLDLLDLLKQID